MGNDQSKHTHITAEKTFMLERKKIRATIDKKPLAQAMAVVVKALLSTIRAEQDDFWVNIEFNVHIQNGVALEKMATVNIYGDLVDPYDLPPEDTIENQIPPEILTSFCEGLIKKD